MSDCLNLADKALQNNKEDTENAIELFSTALEEIEMIKNQKKELEEQWREHLKLDAEYERRMRNSYLMGNFLAVLPSVCLGVTSSFYFMNNEIEMGKKYLNAAAISLISIEMVYQGGHFIFRIW